MTDKRKAIVLVVVLFILGIALGSVGTHLWDSHVLASQARRRPISELKALLQMSPDQEKQFDAIIKQEHSKFNDLNDQERAEWDPKWDAVRQQGRDGIRAILTPDQRLKFEAFLKKFDEERRKAESH